MLFYANVFKAFQKRKTIILKSTFKKNNVRKIFVNRNRLDNSIELKIFFYKMLQSLLFFFTYFTHHDV